MRKRILAVVLLFCLMLSLTACNNPFKLEFGWRKAQVTLFADEVIYWQGDEKADYYKVYIDGCEMATTADEFYILDSDYSGTHEIEVVKHRGKFKYHSKPLTVTKPENKLTGISSLYAVQQLATDGKVYLGSLQSNEYVIRLGESATTFELDTAFYINPTLDRLHVVGRPGQVLSRLSFHVLERTTPLTVLFENVSLSADGAQLFTYEGEGAFVANLVVKGLCSFVNVTEGRDGANGGGASGFASAGDGGAGGNGGGLFDLPTINLFCEATPVLMTGDGGDGGNGGNGANLAHGGYGGSGGNGGFVFTDATVTCFNGSYKELVGSYGVGGEGGSGGSGFSGTRSGGASGGAGGLCNNATVSYISRTDGVKKTLQGEDGDGAFGVSFVNGYLIFNEQENATSYEIHRDGVCVATTAFNSYYIGELTAADSGKLVVRALSSDGKCISTSRALSVYDDSTAKVVTATAGSMTLTGKADIVLDAAALGATTEILVQPDVKRVSIIYDGEDYTDLHLSIVANSRTDDLILRLEGVQILSSDVRPAITVNGGTGSSNAIDPMLIIDANTAAIIGSGGIWGADGADKNNAAEGENGAHGGDGCAAILAPIVVLAGDDFGARGGDGGFGGDGGDSLLNNGGDGGNGGDGAAAIQARMLYAIMDKNDSRILLVGGDGGLGGKGGSSPMGDVGSALNSARNGSAGSAATAYSGEKKIYTGTIVTE